MRISPTLPAALALAAPGGFSATLEDVAEPPVTGYTAPEASDLVAVRPYPGPGSVCQVMGETELTRDFLDHTALLVGCPTQGGGAIGDLVDSGASIVGQDGDWTLLSVPLH